MIARDQNDAPYFGSEQAPLWALPWEPILATRCAELKDAYATIHRPGIDRDVYLVPDGFDRMDCAWRETNLEDMDLEAIIGDLLEASQNPIHVIGFNVSEGWIRDVSEEIAQKLRQRRTYERRELPYSLHELVEQGPRFRRGQSRAGRPRGAVILIGRSESKTGKSRRRFSAAFLSTYLSVITRSPE